MPTGTRIAASARTRRGGRFAPEPTLKETVEAALASDTDECIIWPHGGKPYGKYNNQRVHRYICKAVHGPAPKGKNDAAHSCGVKLCINPRHLSWKSRAGNIEDAKRHGTFVPPPLHAGDDHWKRRNSA